MSKHKAEKISWEQARAYNLVANIAKTDTIARAKALLDEKYAESTVEIRQAASLKYHITLLEMSSEPKEVRRIIEDIRAAEVKLKAARNDNSTRVEWGLKVISFDDGSAHYVKCDNREYAEKLAERTIAETEVVSRDVIVTEWRSVC